MVSADGACLRSRADASWTPLGQKDTREVDGASSTQQAR